MKKSSSDGVDSHDPSNIAPFAVSNIQPLELPFDKPGEEQTELVITCEGIPALFLFTLNAQNEVQFRETHYTEGNVIDMVVLSDRSSMIYSMDNTHNRFSTLADSCDPTSIPLINAIHFSRSAQHWEKDSHLHEGLLPALEETAKTWLVVPQTNAVKGKSLKELLYGLESLRKRRNGADAGDEPAAEEDDAA